MNGLDAQDSLASFGQALRADGYRFVGRYFFQSSSVKKLLTLQEAQHLSGLGIILVAIYENGFPTTPGYFTVSRAALDARRAIICAQQCTMPKGKPVYFAADADLAHSDVRDYFQELHIKMSAAGYKVGVYGSGHVCSGLVSDGFVSHTWLAQSTGWAGYTTWVSHCNIRQLPETTWHGLDVDTDISVTDEFGGWILG